MKKLLSILAISGVIGMSSSTVISCGETTKQEWKNPASLTLNATSPARDQIRTQLVKYFAGLETPVKMTADQIKADPTFGFKIVDKTTGDALGENENATANTVYVVKFEIKDNEYFNDLTAQTTAQGVEVTATAEAKKDWTNPKADELALDSTKTGDDSKIAEQLRADLLKLDAFAKTYTDAAALSKDYSLQILVYAEDGTTPVDTTVVPTSGTKYTVKFAIQNNEYFTDFNLDHKDAGVVVTAK